MWAAALLVSGFNGWESTSLPDYHWFSLWTFPTLCLLWELQWLKAHGEIEITSPTAGGFVGQRCRGDDRDTMLLLRLFFWWEYTLEACIMRQLSDHPTFKQITKSHFLYTKLICLLLTNASHLHDLLKLMLVLYFELKLIDIKYCTKNSNLKDYFSEYRLNLFLAQICVLAYHMCVGESSHMVKSWLFKNF